MAEVPDSHPYLPTDLILPSFVPCFLSQCTILAVFGGASLAVVSAVGSSQDKTGCYLAEVWKEYSKGDSRYAVRYARVVAVEGITAVLEGPASLLVVYAITCGKSYSHILQFAISLGQLYGAVVYFITAILDGDNFSASQFYYYAYYIGANASLVCNTLA